MELSTAFSLFSDLRAAFGSALGPTLQDVIHRPLLMLYPRKLSRVFMSYVWVAFAEGTDEAGRPVRAKLLPQNVVGVVLDIGADSFNFHPYPAICPNSRAFLITGHGHTLNYLDRKLVSTYIALEPNALMHSYSRADASKAGFVESDSSLVILSCGAEEPQVILSQLGILTLCSIPSPERTLHALVRNVLRRQIALL